MEVLERIEEIECETCNGTGKEICSNPDHGFLGAISFADTGRIGCPCCGHDESYAIPNTICENCNGTGKEFIVNYKVIDLAKLGKLMQWVSVNTPPKIEDVCLVRYSSGYKTTQAYSGVGSFCGGISHWMPLPPNPKEAE